MPAEVFGMLRNYVGSGFDDFFLILTGNVQSPFKHVLPAQKQTTWGKQEARGLNCSCSGMDIILLHYNFPYLLNQVHCNTISIREKKKKKRKNHKQNYLIFKLTPVSDCFSLIFFVWFVLLLIFKITKYPDRKLSHNKFT